MRHVQLMDDRGYMKGERYYLTDAPGSAYYEVAWDMAKDTDWIVFVDPRISAGGEFVKKPYDLLTAPTFREMIVEDMKRRGLPLTDLIEQDG